jgi:hypothetical protein
MDPERNSPAPPVAEDAEQENALAWGGTIGGGLLIVLSVIFIVGGMDLGLGTPFRLGTGAFPFITGSILTVLGAAICIRELRGEGLKERPDWIAFLAIGGALALFASTADRIGLVPATFLTIIVASLPDRSLSILGKIVLGGIVSVGCWLLFIETLNLPFKPFIGF